MTLITDQPQPKPPLPSLTPEQDQAWKQTVELFRSKGITAQQVNATVLQTFPQAQGDGLLAAATRTMNTSVTYKSVLYMALGVVAFGVLLKAVGVAFNINIPLLHTATSEIE